jgi:hypothetical protein
MVGRGDLVRIIALHLVTRCKKSSAMQLRQLCNIHSHLLRRSNSLFVRISRYAVVVLQHHVASRSFLDSKRQKLTKALS